MITDQEIIKSYIDKRPTQAILKDLHEVLISRQLDYLAKLARNKGSRSGVIIPNASSIHYVKEDGYLGGLGISSPRDLLTDNFGLMMAFVLTTNPTFMTAPTTFKDITGSTAFNYQIKADEAVFPNQWFAGNLGNAMSIRLGSGVTPAARSDYAIGTALITAPESGAVPFTSACGYSAGVLTMVENIGPFGATETVKEAIIMMAGEDTGGAVRTVCMARYNYTPVSIPLGQTAVTQTTINI